jgi:hypothetical protein
MCYVHIIFVDVLGCCLCSCPMVGLVVLNMNKNCKIFILEQSLSSRIRSSVYQLEYDEIIVDLVRWVFTISWGGFKF